MPLIGECVCVRARPSARSLSLSLGPFVSESGHILRHPRHLCVNATMIGEVATNI